MVEALDAALKICRVKIKEFNDPIIKERWRKLIARYQAWVDQEKEELKNR